MATSVLIPIEEYLQAVYSPDREFVDGEVLERNVGKWEHSRVQALLTSWFVRNEATWRVQTATEWRTQVSPARVRIPDVLLVSTGPQPEVLVRPPVLVVEILSPDDTYADTQQRADDYLRMGVETVWIIDPETRTGRICSASNWMQAKRLVVAGTPIYVDLDQLFSQLDEGATAPR